MTWAILGASGFIGEALAHHLTSDHETVRALRAPRLTSSPAAGVDELVAEALVSPWVERLANDLRESETVVLAAGLATPDAPTSTHLSGANALLPGVVAQACARAGVGRFIHLSSAAVQGRRRVLDESAALQPFSPYSCSKALGEQVLARLAQDLPLAQVVVRATSVQGRDRPTTVALRRVAASPLASVAGEGSAPSAVSSVNALCALVAAVGRFGGELPPVVLQPWEGWTVAEVLRAAGGREPRHLPISWCRTALFLGGVASRLSGRRLDGALRRAEVMWFGQQVEGSWARSSGFEAPDALAAILRGS